MRMTGIVAAWKAERGYGFVHPDDGDDDVFLHVTAVKEAMPPDVGDRVEFEIEPDRRSGRLRAVDVKVLP